MLLANWSVKVQGTEKGAKVLCATGSRGFLFLTGSITLSQIIYTTNNTKQSKSPAPAKYPTIAKSPTTDNNNHEYEMGIWTSYCRSVPPKVNERTTWWSTWFKWGFRRHKWRHFGKTIQASIRAPSGSASFSRHKLRSLGFICNITTAFPVYRSEVKQYVSRCVDTFSFVPLFCRLFCVPCLCTVFVCLVLCLVCVGICFRWPGNVLSFRWVSA